MKRLFSASLFAGLLGLTACSIVTEQPLPPGSEPETPPPAATRAPTAAGQAANPPAAQTSGVTRVDPQITSTLINLFNLQNKYKLNLTTAALQGTAVNDLLSLGSPVGYELRNHYLNIGVPLAEALAHENDPSFHDKLLQLARWTSDGETRAAALMVLANTHHPEDLTVFKEALGSMNLANSLAVRFGAIEALTIWGFPNQALPLLQAEADQDTEPILKVYAAGQLARLGDPSGLPRLRNFLNDGSWLVRAMAAHFLGDYGVGSDYDLIDAKIAGETGNDFVQAEDCIACLKLFPKKS